MLSGLDTAPIVAALALLVFAGIIAVVTALLSLPAATQSGQRAPFVDALFTAISATSVTGLVTVDTADHWNLLGEAIVLLLIQAGGMGFMVGASLVLLTLRRSTSLRGSLIMRDGAPTISLHEARHLSRRILIFMLTIEAIGAIHFADSALIAGEKGIKKEMLYLELQIHGDCKREQIENLGIRAGDPIILKRPIKRGFSKDTFYGPYLDNGLGCFVTAELARLVAEAGGLDNVRCLFTIATHEEIGRMGSRVAAGVLRPDIVIGADVSHDYKAAPGIGDRRMTPIEMGKGFSIKSGSIVSEYLNSLIERACREAGVPYQKGGAGRDTGTDAMAGVFAAIDAAATTIGFPIRNMHTISETGHTGDVLSATWGLFHFLQLADRERVTVDDFRNKHPRLDLASSLHATEVEKQGD